MRRNLFANVFLFVFSVLLATPLTAWATTLFTIQEETGTQINKATAIVKNIKESEKVIAPQFKDTNLLFTGEPMSSLVIYNTAASDGFFLVTGIGDSVVEIAAENIGEGDFVAVNTTEPDGCTTLSLAECRTQTDFIAEQSFSISFDGEVPAPIITTITDPLSDTATSTITTVDIDGTSIVTTLSATTEVSAETTTTDSLANVISAFDDTASSTSNNPSTTVGLEEQADTVIVSDTNAESITSPLPQSDETAASTTPEAEVEIPPLSADANSEEVITSEF